MPDDLLRDLEKWKDEIAAIDDSVYEWEPDRDAFVARFTALLAKHAAPAGPDLRAMVLALREISKRLHYPDVKSDSGPVEVHRYLCDLMTIADSALKAAEPAAPKEWRGPWKCTSSGRVYEPGEEWRHKNEGADECHGTLVPFERRKGGEG